MSKRLPASTIEAAVRENLEHKQARSELTSCAIFFGTTLLIFAVLVLSGEARHMGLFNTFRVVFLAIGAVVIGFAIIARKGWWHPALPFVNTALQISMLSVFLVLTAEARGVAFSLATALPMLYCLAIGITAFRLHPGLCLFAGSLAAVEILAIYEWVMRPMLVTADLTNNPALGWPATIARALTLLALGGACALAAGSLRRQIRRSIEDQDRIHLLERTFGRLVAPEVARQILADENWMRPARRDAAVMFADLQGFTQFSEGKAPEEVAEFLNRCWSLAADIVERHGGVINKYMGDGFLAIFGVPIELSDPEHAAAETAAELQTALAPVLEPAGLALCIGVHAGPMIAGGIGSESRCEFTVIGSTVNLASRLEGLNRALETRCLASEPVARKIAEQWDLTDRGGHRVKGVAGEVSVFEIGRRKNSSPDEDGTAD